MNRVLLFVVNVMILLAFVSCKNSSHESRTISTEVLKDKIAGGWAGKMIGVTYGGPTEYAAARTIYKDPITWTPADIKGSIEQDDIYVQLSFMMAMDKYGSDAPAKKFQEMLAKSAFPLWGANMQARINYYDSIFPPASGSPAYSFRGDDIDFEIEADWIGLMNPGMPQNVIKIADRIGHVMNYGDGVYGGIFVAAMESAAFFEKDIKKIVDQALLTIPVESDYYKIVRDVIKLHKQFPDDWRAAWKEIDAKWGDGDITRAGNIRNPDAKFNGAFVVLGLLYGEGDPMKTLEITTRCGQDSDCNPSTAMAVLGVVIGFSHLPVDMQNGVRNVAEINFQGSEYSFNRAVENTYNYAVKFVEQNGGKVSGTKIAIPVKSPVPLSLEVTFPAVAFEKKATVFEKNEWKLKGNWQVYRAVPRGGGNKEIQDQAMSSDVSGDTAEITFVGSGISIMGNLFRDGGKADIYLDGKLHRTIDTYYNYAGGQQHKEESIWHVFRLQPGKHTVKLVVRGEKRSESEGTKVYVCFALIYNTAPKKSDSFRFSFEGNY